MKKAAFFFIKIVVGLGIILALFKYIPYSELIEAYRKSNKIYIVLAGLVFYGLNILGVFRWHYILRSLDLNLSFKEVFYTSFSGIFFNLFFPSLVAGDAFKSMAIGLRHKQAFKAISSVVMDRFSGLVAVSLLALGAFVIGGESLREKDIVLFVAALLVLTVGFIFIILNESFFHFIEHRFAKGTFNKKINDFFQEFSLFRRKPAVFVKSICCSLVIQGIFCITFYLLSKAFYLDVSVLYFFIFIPIVQFIAAIPLTIAGMGTREAAMVYFFSKIGVSTSIALSMSLMVLFFIVLVSLTGGLIYVTVYHRWLESNLQNTFR